MLPLAAVLDLLNRAGNDRIEEVEEALTFLLLRHLLNERVPDLT